jgi:glucokinase
MLPPAWDLSHGAVAGVDIGGTQCSVNVGTYGDGHFELVSRSQFPTHSRRGHDRILAEIEDGLRAALLRRPDIEVIGISCGGPMDAANGIIQSPPNLPGWDDVPVTARLREALGVRCVLENDANASAVAEWAYGAGRGAANLIYLTFGTGLGAGMILDGALYRGAGDLAGEVGHWRIGPDAGPVHYGKRGSFEGYCSGSGIVGWYQYFAENTTDEVALSAEVISRRAREGEELAMRVFDQAARQLGNGIAILVDALAPELVIVGGIYRYATDLLESGMWRALAAEGHPRLVKGMKVVPSRLGREVGSYASCSVALLDLAASAAPGGGSRSAPPI